MPSDDVLRLEGRLDRIEATLDRFAAVLDRLPGAAAGAVDSADEVARRMARRGVDLDARVAAALGAVERLTEPGTLDALVRVAEQAERLQPVLRWAASAEATVAMGIDGADELARRAAARGIDLDDRFAAGLRLLERVSEPETAAALERLVTHAARLEPVVRLAAHFEDHLALLVDSADAWARARQADGIDLDQRATDGFAMLLRLASPELQLPLGRLLDVLPALARHADEFPRQLALAATVLEHVERFSHETGRTPEQLVDDGALALVRLATLGPALFESGVLDPETVRVLGRIGRELPAVVRSSPPPVGVFGLIGAFSDPEVQRALGIALAMARRASAVASSSLSRS